ncbi:MAG: V-type ATPase subunit [Lachnospiraceae bacterium]|nr:V-type ATPase subunit [Lachnospiraceae bacterium]
MGNLLSYSGIVTKVHAMNAKLLTPDNFDEITHLGSVGEVVNYLKNQPAYADDFSHLDEHLLHRGDVEKILIESLYNDYSKLYRFSDMHIRQFLKLYLKRYEVDLINYCFRIVFNHYDEPFDLNHKKAFFDKYSQISIDKLITSRTMEELVENLKGTEYYTTLKKLQESNASTLFDYDLALDLYYFSTVWKEKKKILKGKELENFTRDCGSKMDFLNLQWIYRAKKYYNMIPADIYALIIPIKYHIHADTLRELVEAPTAEDYVALVYGTYYGKRYNFEKPLSLESMYTNCLYHLYMADCRNNPYSIATINKYLFLKEEELRKLTTALECIRYDLPPGETLRYMGGVTQ